MFPVSSIPLFHAFLFHPPTLEVSSSLLGVPLLKAEKDIWFPQPLPASSSLFQLKPTPGSLCTSSVGCSEEHVPSHCLSLPSKPKEPNSFLVFVAELCLCFQQGLILQRKAWLTQYIYFIFWFCCHLQSYVYCTMAGKQMKYTLFFFWFFSSK